MPYGGTFKLNLHMNSSLARLTYSPDPSDSHSHKSVIMEKGELKLPPERNLEGRFSMEGSVCILQQVTASDAGLYQVTDQEDFLASKFYLVVERKEQAFNLNSNGYFDVILYIMYTMSSNLWTPDYHTHMCLLNIPLQI